MWNHTDSVCHKPSQLAFIDIIVSKIPLRSSFLKDDFQGLWSGIIGKVSICEPKQYRE